MSKRRHISEVTDPGRPPEEALDATLAALGEPVAAEARNTAESAGLEAARYHGEARRPPRAHEPSAATTEPTVDGLRRAPVNDTLRMSPREALLEGTTVPRAAPMPSRLSAFAGALFVVVLLLGGTTWALFGRGSATSAAPDTSAPAPAATTPKTALATAAATMTNASASTTSVPVAIAAPAAAVVEAAPTTTARDPAFAPAAIRTPATAPSPATTAAHPAASASTPAAPPATTPRASAPSVVVPVPPPTATTSRTDLSPIQ
jgi:hypothetical protein